MNESIWTVAQDEIESLAGGDGTRFSSFVDDIIRAEMAKFGVVLASLATDRRTVSDGGVDTELKAAIAASPSGFFSVPTCWQYKSSKPTDAKLRKELNKPYVVELVKRGYGYRLAIARMTTPEDRDALLKIVVDELRKTHSSFEPPLVVGADHLATMASASTGLVKRYFRRELAAFLSIEDWAPKATHEAPVFSEISTRSSLRDGIRRHADVAQPVKDVLFPLIGESGVGKTRLVYESLKDAPSSVLVVYTLDSRNAEELAVHLANSDNSAVLVVDEATTSTKAKLRALLESCANRVRTFTIETSDGTDAGYQSVLKRMERKEVEDTLAANYPETRIPRQRLRAYSELAEGFPKFALYLCRHDDEIAAGQLSGALRSVADVLARLPQDEQEALRVLSLVHQVGYRDEVVAELRALCELVHQNHETVLASAERLIGGPGFVGRAGRYLHVTPGIVAQTSLDIAWFQWARPDVPAFLDRVSRLEPALLDAFQSRIAQYGSPEVQADVATFFRSILVRAQPSDLADAELVDRLIRIVEIDLKTNTTLLRQLIERASVDELRAVSGTYRGRWGSRRALVWLAERAAAFPHLFGDAERIMWRLALAESEPSIGNNATAQWKQLFRIFLSGTATPYIERLNILRHRLQNSDGEAYELAVAALTSAFETYLVRTETRPMLGGKIPPSEWFPATNQEAAECVFSALSALKEQLDSAAARRSAAVDALLKHVWGLIATGYLSKVQEALKDVNLTDSQRSKLVEIGREFLERSGNALDRYNTDYVNDLREWVEALLPKNDHGRLMDLLAMPRHLENDALEAWTAQVETLITSLLEQGAFWSEREQINRADPYQMLVIGRAVGRKDDHGDQIDEMIVNAQNSGAIPLATGYFIGLRDQHPERGVEVTQAFDALAEAHPSLAFEIAIEIDGLIDAKRLVLSLVERMRVDPRALGRLAYCSITMDREFLLRILKILVEAQGASARDAAVALLDYAFSAHAEASTLRDDAALRELAWTAVSPPPFPSESYRWEAVVRRLAVAEPVRAAKVAVAAMRETEFYANKSGEAVARELLARVPGDLIREFLDLLRDDSAIAPLVHSYRDLLKAIPASAAHELIGELSLSDVRRLARHLPAPYRDPQGEPLVPPITSVVLDRFGNDDETVGAFAVGTRHLLAQWGKLSEVSDSERVFAERLISHPSEGIRRWAEWEVRRASAERDRWKQREQEEELQK